MKSLADIVNRPPLTKPALDKIPWDDPNVSKRMLREHLRQDHDAASRRTETIEAQVAWIDEHLLGKNARVLDLGCGPGFYTTRLARRGHSCGGIDFSPASIGYAIDTSEGLDCRYRQADVRSEEFDGPYDLVMMLFGEIGTFTREEAGHLLRKAHGALDEGGRLLIEATSMTAVRRLGRRVQMWYARDEGPFSDEPHVVLLDQAWDEENAMAMTNYYVIDAASAEVSEYGERMFGYTDEEYIALIEDAGFTGAEIDWSFPSAQSDTKNELMALLATKGAA